MAAGRVLFDLTFEIAPIVLTGGIAGSIAGAAVPLINYLQPGVFASIASGSSSDTTLDQYFAHFRPLPGSTLIENEIAKYPFANQTVAANAIIVDPLHVSLLMLCPVNPPNTYAQKYLIMTALQALLAQHTLLGGLYTVATPSFIYQNCILMKLSEVSRGESQQPQIMWQWDFEQPLVSIQGAQQSYNNMMSKFAAQTPIGPDPSGGISTSGIGNMTGVGTAPVVGVDRYPLSPLTGDSNIPVNQDFSGGQAGPSSGGVAGSSAPLPTTLPEGVFSSSDLPG